MAAILDRVRFLTGDPQELPESDTPEDEPTPVALDPDPEPGRRARRRSAASKITSARQTRTAGKFVSAKAQRAQIGEELEVYLKMLSMTWSVRDPDCAGVLNDQSKKIASELANLVSRSEWLMQHLATTTLLTDCVKLLHALMPVASALISHGHIPGIGGGRAQDEVEGSDDQPTYFNERYAAYQP